MSTKNLAPYNKKKNGDDNFVEQYCKKELLLLPEGSSFIFGVSSSFPFIDELNFFSFWLSVYFFSETSFE